MAGMNVEISIPDLEAFRRKLTTEEILGNDVRAGVEKLMLVIQGKARTYAKPHSGDRGELARSIKYELGPTAIPIGSRVYTDKLYAAPAEYGRRPGRMPPVAPIADWLRRHGEDPARGYIVARAIGRRGTTGLFYMRRAAEEGMQSSRAIFDEVADSIERRWARG